MRDKELVSHEAGISTPLFHKTDAIACVLGRSGQQLASFGIVGRASKQKPEIEQESRLQTQQCSSTIAIYKHRALSL